MAETAEYVLGSGKLAAEDESGEDMVQTYDMEVVGWMPRVAMEEKEWVAQNHFHCEGGCGANGFRYCEVAAIVREDVDESCTVNLCRRWDRLLQQDGRAKSSCNSWKNLVGSKRVRASLQVHPGLQAKVHKVEEGSAVARREAKRLMGCAASAGKRSDST